MDIESIYHTFIKRYDELQAIDLFIQQVGVDVMQDVNKHSVAHIIHNLKREEENMTSIKSWTHSADKYITINGNKKLYH